MGKDKPPTVAGTHRFGKLAHLKYGGQSVTFICMLSSFQLRKLSRAQKLKAMEDLWDDLTHEEGRFKSPSWHADALTTTEAAIKAGKVKFTNWEKAKSKLRKLSA